MGSPEDREKKRRRIRSHIAKDLGTKKYRQRVKEDGKKKKPVDVKSLTHSELIRLINENAEED